MNKAAPAANAGLEEEGGQTLVCMEVHKNTFRDALRTFIPKSPGLKASACPAGTQPFQAAMGVHWLILSFLAVMDLCQASNVS